MKKLPIGLQSLSKLINNQFVYVDKTKEILPLLEGSGAYFFSRPRRFGKSLLLSTFEEIFSGNRALFKNLWIDDKITWKKYPIIFLDFSLIANEPFIFGKLLSLKLDDIAASYQLTLKEKDVQSKFAELISSLGQQEQVVILIDEYDKPLIDHIENLDYVRENQNLLKRFYGALKGLDKYIRFVFITGVSRFSRISIFSDLNHLSDISLDKNYATLCGYTQAELEQYFTEELQATATELSMPIEALKEKVKLYYNGYDFNGKQKVYNPFSILNFLDKQAFDNFWFVTGTPTFLVKIANQHLLEDYDNETVRDIMLANYDIELLGNYLVPLMFQTGYLTIKERLEDGFFRLGYPNKEVRDAFNFLRINDLLQYPSHLVHKNIYYLAQALKAQDKEAFIKFFTALYASIPSYIFIEDKEAYYHTIFYLTFKVLGFTVLAEDPTNKGRIDMVLETPNIIYICELKLTSVANALKQIDAKGYAEKFQNADKQLIKLAVLFDADKKNIEACVFEPIKK